MNDLHKELTEKWLKKASNDLKSAYKLLQYEDLETDNICFHCQQSIEKSLKAYLVFREIEFRKTHDLIYLLHLTDFEDATKKLFSMRFTEINYYAVSGRYPDDSPEPTYEETIASFNTAIEVFEYVNKLINNVIF